MRVLVCGGRDFADAAALEEELDGITNTTHGGKWSFELICGMATGADTLAYEWAKKHDMIIHEYPADWDKFGKSAGYVRNAQMLRDGQPDLVVAFPGEKGTKMMVDLAEAAGVEVRKVGW